jgi:2-dehydropantoate 2-reductase
MRIGVIGAGAVGGVLAALLDRAGHEVEVTARGEHLAAIREHGLRVDGAWGDHTAFITASETLQRAADLVILTTKAQDAATALLSNHTNTNGTAVLVVQNGLNGVTSARAVCADSPIAGALALFAASYVAPGRVTVTAAAPTYIGGESPSGPATALALDAFRGVIPVSESDRSDRGSKEAPVDGFAGAQWTKLIVNQINALPAITGKSAQAVIAHRALRHIMTASMHEAVKIGLRSGVRFGTLLGLNHLSLSVFARLPLWLAQALPRELGRRMGDTPNPGSTLQSIRRGQLTEIDFLNGAIVDAATVAGTSAPINAALVTLVHEVESRGRFYTPAEIVSRLEAVR